MKEIAEGSLLSPEILLVKQEVVSYKRFEVQQSDVMKCVIFSKQFAKSLLA